MGLGNDHLTWRGAVMVFLQKNILIPNIAEINMLIIYGRSRTESTIYIPSLCVGLYVYIEKKYKSVRAKLLDVILNIFLKRNPI